MKSISEDTVSGVTPATGSAQASVAVDAYVYFYSLVTTDVTLKQMTNIHPGEKPGFGPMNMFHNIPAFPPADMKAVVRPNFDTLYSSAWLDLTKEPLIVSAPDTDGRYYLLPMLDMWTDVFASPGSRAEETLQSDHATLRAAARGSDRQVESASDQESGNDPAFRDAIRRTETRPW